MSNGCPAIFVIITDKGRDADGTAGIAWTDPDSDFVDDSSTAFVIGAGAEFDMARYWRNVTAGVEGLYYAFEEEEGDVGPFHYEADSSAFILRGRVNYHFNQPY